MTHERKGKLPKFVVSRKIFMNEMSKTTLNWSLKPVFYRPLVFIYLGSFGKIQEKDDFEIMCI